MVAAAVLVGVGCSGGGQGGGGDGARPLRIAVEEDYGPLNILNTSNDQLLFLVYDRLVAPSPYAAHPQPWLASAVREVDPQTWEVSLRSDVRWQDGRPFTAEDVVFTINWFKKVPSGTYSHHVTTVPNIDTVQALGPYQLRLHCAYPCTELGSDTLAFLPMLPQHIWARIDEPTKYTEPPIGTGPYRLVSYSPDTGYRFAANRDYFAGRPTVDQLLMPIIPDPAAAFTALRTGEVDAVAHPVPPELVAPLEHTPGITLARTTPLQFPELKINFRRPPLDQPEFRRALSLAVDRQALVNTVWLGQGRAAVQGYPHPSSPWTDPGLRTPSDPAAARQLLDQLGLRDSNGDGLREDAAGRTPRFTIKVAGNEPTLIRAAQLVADQLRAVGIGMNPVRTLDAGSLTALNDSHDFDFTVDVITAHGVADPQQFVMSQYSGYLWQLPSIPYPQLSALVARWQAATTLEELKQAGFALQELFNQAPTSIPLVYPVGVEAFRPGAYAGWVESPGYGVFCKWSLLPRQVAVHAGALAGYGS